MPVGLGGVQWADRAWFLLDPVVTRELTSPGHDLGVPGEHTEYNHSLMRQPLRRSRFPEK